MNDEKIKEIREKVGEAIGSKCSQEKFGQFLGVTWRTVSRWEKGLIEPDNKNTKKLESLESILDDDEKRDEILSFLKSGNISAVTSIIGLMGAAMTTASILPIAGLGIASLVFKLMKGKDE